MTTLDLPYVTDRYKEIALQCGLSSKDILSIERYAQKLEANGLPVIFDEKHFSALVGYDISLLYAISNDQRKFYRSFNIPKRNGKLRQIDEPLPTLKEIQRYILDNILSNVEISKASKAFSRHSDIKKNARIHIRQPEILKVDIKDFFPSVNISSVYKALYALGYTDSLAMLFAQICCLDKSLPQGAPTSPALANIVCRDLDHDLLKYCTDRNLRYTRYADDITISGERIKKETITEVRFMIKSFKFKLNEEKTSIMRSGSRKVVTGIIVNTRMQAPRETRREFRKNVFFIRKFGVDGHISQIEEDRNNYLRHIIGVGEFILWVDNKNKEVVSDLNFLKRLLKSESVV
ncbi:reverse transcriptase family protein [Methylosinus sp. C49]|uniref:reverse transcriptase family protein n=1 Tax=Methylosinus sp. C49 TaxID=2699395 RepID=UPI0013797398|nr:reverse transcriptase family protein [Methylosinus sp. C49]